MSESSAQIKDKKRQLIKFFNETSNFINKLAVYLSSISKTSIDDLKQEGFLGVYRASKTYDKEKASFFTYAQFWIRTYMYSSAFKNAGFMHVPNRFYCIYSRYKKLCEAKELHTNPARYEIIAAELSITPSYLIKIIDLVDLIKNSYSMDDCSGTVEIPEAAAEFSQDDVLNSNQFLEEIRKVITPKEYFVLNHVLGLEVPVKRTLLWIGKILGVTKERVRQIKCSALKKIKQSLADKPEYMAFFKKDNKDEY